MGIFFFVLESFKNVRCRSRVNQMRAKSAYALTRTRAGKNPLYTGVKMLQHLHQKRVNTRPPPVQNMSLIVMYSKHNPRDLTDSNEHIRLEFCDALSAGLDELVDIIVGHAKMLWRRHGFPRYSR